MNFIFSLILIIVSVIVLGGISIFLMNNVSHIFYKVFINKKNVDLNFKYYTSAFLLSITHAYIWLSWISFVILICYGCTANSKILIILLWIITGIICIIMTWVAHIQAKQKLNDIQAKSYEGFHTTGLALNALISSIAFFVLSIFPSLITYGWGWVENLSKLIL